jgi:3-oxoacyl-[acyl-carrier-protein] synthase-3
MFSRITGVGGYLPEKRLTNHDLEKMIDTSDEWIVSRTGIRERRIHADNELTSDLALKASQQAIAHANIDVNQIDLIIVATTTPDQTFPSTACILQKKLGIHGFPAFDVQAVCSGFMYALATADMYLKGGMAKCALVIGAETMSDLMDWADRSTCILFGDGAGAIILQPDEQHGILSTELRADGRYGDILKTASVVRGGQLVGDPYLRMEGNAVFRFAVKALAEVAQAVLTANNIEQSALDWLIPHQANIRIIESTAKHLHLPMEKVVLTLAYHGNTSAASVPLALNEAVHDGRIQRGQLIMLEGIGGGFAWGATLLRF